MGIYEQHVLPEGIAYEVLQYCDVPYAIVSSTLAIEYCASPLRCDLVDEEEFLNQLNQVLTDNCIGSEEPITFRANESLLMRVHELNNGSYLVIRQQEDDASEELSMINNGLAELADCNLNAQFKANQQKDFQSEAFLQTTIANLNEVVKQIYKSCSRINGTSLHLNAQSKELAERSSQQSEATELTSSSMEELNATIASNAQKTAHAEKVSVDAVGLAKDGNRSIEDMSRSIANINDSAEEMHKIIETVDLIAFQTNILSINAAVEAAHAGEHGRGFSIVAQEVRALARRSANASSEIKDLITSTIEACTEAKAVAEESSKAVTQMSQKILEICDDLSSISTASQEQATGIGQVTRSVVEIASLAELNNSESNLLSNHTAQLQHEVEQMQDVIGIFKINENSFSHPLHRQICDLVKQAGSDIKARIEDSILRNDITREALFDRHYIEIPDTNPVRYNTKFDQFTDDYIGPVQELWLKKHPSLIYLILSDENGYVPTHNLAFSQPLTGNYSVDVARNRTKRIFTDRVGQTVGKHTEPFLIQTYRRDTGELMFDLSIPLFFQGEHWGAIRAGYRLQV